jgi:hypothetical protein
MLLAVVTWNFNRSAKRNILFYYINKAELQREEFKLQFGRCLREEFVIINWNWENYIFFKFGNRLIKAFGMTLLNEIERNNSLFLLKKLKECIAPSNEILGWEGVGNRQLLCFFTA